MMTVKIRGGVDIAMKIPPHQFDAMVAFYHDIVGLEPITEKAPAVGFELGPNKLWLDPVPTMSQAEIWLELFTENFDVTADHLERAGVVRCDPIEPLPDGFKGWWITSPANIIYMVREPDAW